MANDIEHQIRVNAGLIAEKMIGEVEEVEKDDAEDTEVPAAE